MHFSAGGPNLLPLSCVHETVESVYPPSPSNNKDSERQYEEKFNFGFLNCADVNEAVELSIAASEALVIHELVKRELASMALPTESVLEVALQVKQARLEILEEAFSFQTEESDICYSLSDLDDVAMTDAFEDVGLSYNNPDDQCACDSAQSHVKETPLFENRSIFHNGLNHIDIRSQQVDSNLISTHRHLEDNMGMDVQLTKDLCPGSLDCERKRKRSHGPVQVSTTSKLAAYVDSILHQSIQENSGGLFMKQEEDAHALSKQKNARSVPAFFLGETSFLSESADIAPDENSFVHELECMSKFGSQSSVHVEGSLQKAHEEILLSQDVVRSSILSFVDPLCSVVPCSIPPENVSSTQGHNLNDGENTRKKCSRPLSEHGMENLQRTLNQNLGPDHGDNHAAYTVNIEASGVSTRRQMTSLKTYSMLVPNPVCFLEGGCLYYNQSFQLEYDQGKLSSDQNTCCSMSSDKRGSIEFLHSRPVSNYAGGRNNEDTQETTINNNSVAEMTNLKRNLEKTTREEDMSLIQPLERRISPCVMNQRASWHLLSSKHSVKSFTGHPRHALVPGCIIKHHQSKIVQNMQSKGYNFHDNHARKRVHFSEAEDLLQQTKNPPKQQFSHQNCPTLRARKGPNLSKKWSRAYGMKSCLTKSSHKVKKRLNFLGKEFLVTGFSSEKTKEIEGLIWKYGGIVLLDIPSPNSRGKGSARVICQHSPVILCLKKLKTTKFLYGCAVNAIILKVDWLTDSIVAGSILLPEKYMILSNRVDAICTRSGKLVHLNNNMYIFERVGIMLHGKHSFCTKFAKIFRHGGGQVFKTLQWLIKDLDNKKIFIGAIIAEDESTVSRQLKHCAAEREILMMPASWIINSLHSGKLLPIAEKNYYLPLPTNNIPEAPISMGWSEEI
ncbi:uncharacterized protein LOC121240062 isoform X1 [Juglans microcarpa x Juglans regia]|uniref:uncharacterized protein LOC121240062 isoform X1 n=1 Tax=Juglans microcarpa x Juglans regia TaxID=2249226 RepID=UPI001B7E9102|nr:uncharacterized protein LOC121240062 isoform X1 [Juglans microcarpa x Juglans regia]